MVSSQEKSIFECKWYAYCIEVTGVEGSIQVWIFQTVYLCTNKDHTEIAFRTFSFLVRFLSSHDLVRMQKSTTYFYRVPHIETNDSKWLWGVEGTTYFFELWCLVASRGLGIWVSSTSFQKSGWPQQPPAEKVLKFNVVFHDSTQNFFFSKYPNKVEFNDMDNSSPQ